MIGYITVGTQNLEKAKKYWSELLDETGANVFSENERIFCIGTGPDQIFFAVCKPFDGSPSAAGNGNMVAFKCETKNEVDRLYAKAIELGGTDDGPAGERGPTFYGGYFKDLDGNKACFYKMG